MGKLYGEEDEPDAMLRLKALLIDFDGTLADHESVFAEELDGLLGLPGRQMFRLWLEVHREEVHASFPDRHEDPAFHLERVARRAGLKPGRAEAEMFRAAFQRGAWRSSRQPRFHRDSLEFLRCGLRREAPLFALSTGDRAAAKARAAAQAIGRPAFRLILSEETLGIRKDRPEFFRRACERLRLRPREVAYLGDLPLHDVGPARSAGLWSVYVNRKGEAIPPDHPKPHFEVRDLWEARRVLGLI